MPGFLPSALRAAVLRRGFFSFSRNNELSKVSELEQKVKQLTEDNRVLKQIYEKEFYESQDKHFRKELSEEINKIENKMNFKKTKHLEPEGRWALLKRLEVINKEISNSAQQQRALVTVNQSPKQEEKKSTQSNAVVNSAKRSTNNNDTLLNAIVMNTALQNLHLSSISSKVEKEKSEVETEQKSERTTTDHSYSSSSFFSSSWNSSNSDTSSNDNSNSPGCE